VNGAAELDAHVPLLQARRAKLARRVHHRDRAWRITPTRALDLLQRYAEELWQVRRAEERRPPWWRTHGGNCR